jgi:thiamine biosynthesis lipoprotein
MGTVVSIRLGAAAESAGESAAAAGIAAQQVFADLNERFSLYSDTSEISKIARGELALTDASEQMRDAYGVALTWRDATHGAFTPHRPDGALDLSGTIKAVAIHEAAAAIRSSGFDSFSLNAGGDILTAGSPDVDDEPGRGWRTGIVDPQNRGALVAAVELTPEFPAMATSGSAERGDHIWARPGATHDFLQATVIAADIVTADVLATAIISGGQEALDQVTANFAVAVLVVKTNGELLANARFPELVAH